MKSDRMVVLAAVFLLAGVALLFGFTSGTTGLSLGYPLPESRLHVDITTTGFPVVIGLPLLAAGALLLLAAVVAALAQRFRERGDHPPADLPTRRHQPFEE